MSDRSIREAINHITGTHLADKVYAVDGTIISVDERARTCTVEMITGKARNTIPGVRLMASVDDGVLIIPETGSNVGVIISDFTQAYVSQYSGVSKIILRGGDLGGMVKVETLTTKLNNLENKLNDLITKFNSHTHNVTAVGSPTGPNLAIESGTLTPTQRDEIENKNVSHG